MRPLRLMLAAVILMLTASGAEARPEPVKTPGAEISPGAHVSYSQWAIDGARIRLRYMISANEAQAMAGPGKPRLRTSEVADAVSQNLTVSSNGGDCYAIDQGEGVGEIYTMAITPGLDRFEIVYVCDDPKGIVLHDKFLFDKVKGHINYAKVQVGSAPPALGQFTRTSQALAVPVRSPGLGAFARQGAVRLLHRPEALGLLAALVLLILRWKDLGWIVAGLTGGYAVSLALAGAGLVLTRPPLSATATGVLVVAAAAAGLRRQAGEAEPAGLLWRILATGVALAMAVAAAVPAYRVGDLSLLATGGIALLGLGLVSTARTVGRSGWVLLAPSVLFGLLDGMGPASDLSVLALPWKTVMPALIGSDLGAGGLAVVLVATAAGLLWIAGRRFGSVRKPVADIAAAALIGLGVFWFVSRLYS